jgi:hypothetical protein
MHREIELNSVCVMWKGKKGFDFHLANMVFPCERFLRKCRHHYGYGPLSERRRNEMKVIRRLIRTYRARDGPFSRTEDDYLEYINDYIRHYAGPGTPGRNFLASTFVDRVLDFIPDRRRSVNKDLEFLSMCAVWFSEEPREE